MIAFNNVTCNITTDNEVASMLAFFNSNYILDLVKDNLANKFRSYGMDMPNIVYSFEQHFKQLESTYTGDLDKIQATRIETYKEIIRIICNEYQLQFNEALEQDFYSSAFYVYKFLVSEFSSNIVNFFVNYIIKEKNSLYDLLNLSTLKKNKNSSTIYGRKMYKNNKFGVIHANLDFVIDNICQFDITLDTLLNNVYIGEKYIVRYIESIIAPIQDLFKFAFVPILYGPLRPIIITNIRLKLQQLTVESENILNVKPEEEL